MNEEYEIPDNFDFHSLYEPTVILREEPYELKESWQIFVKQEQLESQDDANDAENKEHFSHYYSYNDIKQEAFHSYEPNINLSISSTAKSHYQQEKSCEGYQRLRGHYSSSIGTPSFSLDPYHASEDVDTVTRIATPENEIIHKCFVCDYETKFMEDLIKHAIDHTYKNSKMFQVKQTAGLHNSVSNLSKPKLFKCSECTYETNRKFNLKTHSLNHSSTKNLKCSECDYETNDKSNLNSHFLIHSSTKLFKCKDCSYETNRKGSLKNHMLIHSNKKLFRCSECNYKCNHKGNLKIHLLNHSSTKLFKCSECDYKCNHKGNLKTHSLTHSNTI